MRKNQLPTIEMIAGETCPFVFRVSDLSHLGVSASACQAVLTVSPYVNDESPPIIHKTANGIVDGVLQMRLDSADTLSLRGKFVYQLQLSDGKEMEAYSGYLIIHANRAQDLS